MSPLPAFPPSRTFLTDVLPGLIPKSASLTHVVATYNRIGTRRPGFPAEILSREEMVTILFSELAMDRIQSDVTRIIADESDPRAPMIATVYVGGRRFPEMLQLIVRLREFRPDARIVAIACPCITQDQENTLRRGVRAGTFAAAAWSDCGGTNMTQDILRALEKNWIPAEADFQPPLSSTDSSADLGA